MRDTQLTLMNADGSGAQPVMDLGPNGFTLDLSPDGEHLTFYRSLNTRFGDIYRIDADGTNVLQLTSFPGSEIGGRWSPDGTQILFDYRQEDFSSTVFVVNADGTGVHQINTNPEFQTWSAGWSPDGAKVLIGIHTEVGGGSFEMYLMNPDGTGLTPLVPDDDGYLDENRAWSPDGTAILFLRYSTDNALPSQLYTISPDGSNVAQVTNFTGVADDRRTATWSPDSSRIMYVNGVDRKIYTMHRDGTELTALTDGSESIASPTWSPDGSMILYVRLTTLDPLMGTVEGDLFVMRADGTGVTQLTSGPSHDYWPIWSPSD